MINDSTRPIGANWPHGAIPNRRSLVHGDTARHFTLGQGFSARSADAINTISMLMSAGLTPLMRPAWPRFCGRI